MNPRKPTRVKQLEGNPGKRKLNLHEPRPRPGAPSCPTWLTTEAKAEWRRIVKDLDAVGILAKVDRATLAVFCQQWALFKEAIEIVKRDGMVLKIGAERYSSTDSLGNVTETVIYVKAVQNPMLRVAKDAAVIIRQMAAEFGLTAYARARLEVPDLGDEEFDELFGAPVAATITRIRTHQELGPTTTRRKRKR